MKKQNKKEIKFTIHERRILGLPIVGIIPDGPENKALRKILDTFPWMLGVYECHFDEQVLLAALVSGVSEIDFKQVQQQYFKKKLARRTQNESI